MAEVQLKKKVTLIGRLETPMVSSKPFIKKGEYWIKVVKDLENDKFSPITSVSKLVKGEWRKPTILRAYQGFILVSCVGTNEEKLFAKISSFMTKRFIGGYSSEGFGRVKWLESKIETLTPRKVQQRKKIKIRKGLGTNYPQQLQKLLIALMLHDFVHTKRHLSKIYQEVQIEDKEIEKACKDHHNINGKSNTLLSAVKYYDGLASYISRKKKLKVTSRYDWEKGEMDFKKQKGELEQIQSSVYKLYNYIYHSKELERIVESMDYGNNNLRNHLLLMVNLAINDYYSNNLILSNSKFKISNVKSVSLSASECEVSQSNAMDAEMHSSLTMSNANSERATTSKKRRLGT